MEHHRRSALSRFPSVEAGRARANRRRPLGSEPLPDDRVVKRLAPLRFRVAHAAHVQLGLQVDRLHPIGDGTCDEGDNRMWGLSVT